MEKSTSVFDNVAIFQNWGQGREELYSSRNLQGQPLASYEEAAEMIDYFMSHPKNNNLNLTIKAVR